MYRALTFVVAGLLASLSAAAASIDCVRCEAWNREQAPLRIFGNTYYVGPHGLSSVLVTSPDGHVLIDGALPQSAPLIAQHVEQLGFKMSDVKVILNSHVHYDHAGGIADLQKASGAKVIASDIAAKVLRTGKVDRNDPQFLTLKPYPGASNVEALGSRDSVNAVSDNSFKYGGDERYPKAAADMAASIQALAAAPCDILIAAHPEFTGLWSIIDEQGKGDRARLVDSSACKRYAAAGKERLDKRLQDEKGAGRPPQ